MGFTTALRNYYKLAWPPKIRWRRADPIGQQRLVERVGLHATGVQPFVEDIVHGGRVRSHLQVRARQHLITLNPGREGVGVVPYGVRSVDSDDNSPTVCRWLEMNLAPVRQPAFA